MAKNDDFVKIHRSLIEWEWYHDDRCVRLFLHLILNARYVSGKWQGISIEAGQLPTSTVKLAAELRWSRSAVVRTLEKLTRTGEVDTKSDSNRTLVTVVNWAKWQGSSQKPDSKPDTNRTRTGHEPDTLKEGKKGRSNTTPSGVVARGTLDERRSRFIADCKAVTSADPDRIAKAERKAFVEYWTETNSKGVMRFEAEEFFDHARRMTTWQKRADKGEPISSNVKPWLA